MPMNAYQTGQLDTTIACDVPQDVQQLNMMVIVDDDGVEITPIEPVLLDLPVADYNDPGTPMTQPDPRH
jgi:hypothetical protein